MTALLQPLLAQRHRETALEAWPPSVSKSFYAH